MNGNFPYMVDCWADPVVHHLLLKRSMYVMSVLVTPLFLMKRSVVLFWSNVKWVTELKSNQLIESS